MKRFLLIFFTLLLSSTSFVALGSAPEVSVSIKPDSILIGDRAFLDVVVKKDIMQVVNFPVFKDNKMNEYLEVLAMPPSDTISIDGREHTIRQRYVVTSFDAGIYNLEQFPVVYADKNVVDTMRSSQSLVLKVATLPVDTENTTIYDIKRPEEAPILFSEYRGYLLWSILILGLLFVLIYFIVRYVRKMRSRAGVKKVENTPKEPPHVRAIRELEELYNQKLCQRNKHKLYYTSLTDIIRVYLDGRYAISAMEMTSDEILRDMVTHSLSDKNSKELRGLLYSADLVKFAKYIPDEQENERVYRNAYYFVEETKEDPQAAVEVIEAEDSTDLKSE